MTCLLHACEDGSELSHMGLICVMRTICDDLSPRKWRHCVLDWATFFPVWFNVRCFVFHGVSLFFFHLPLVYRRTHHGILQWNFKYAHSFWSSIAWTFRELSHGHSADHLHRRGRRRTARCPPRQWQSQGGQEEGQEGWTGRSQAGAWYGRKGFFSLDENVSGDISPCR